MDWVIGARAGAASIPTALSQSTSAASSSARSVSNLSTSGNSFSSVGSKAIRGDDLVTGKNSTSKLNSARTGAAVQVRASTNVNPKDFIAKLFGGKVKDAGLNNVVYKGVASIAKKRAEVTNLVQFDLVDVAAGVADNAAELFGQKIEIQLVSEDVDPKTNGGKVSAKSTVDGWLTNKAETDVVADQEYYPITFTVPKDFGQPGAFIIQNHHPNEFYIKSLALEAPDKTIIEFPTNAWIYNHRKYPKDRVFFTNKLHHLYQRDRQFVKVERRRKPFTCPWTEAPRGVPDYYLDYLPSATPPGLNALREQELEQIRGDGKGERQPWDRIYDYDTYDDLGDPDEDKSLARPVLGGSKEFPYPRRVRSGRPMSKTDPTTESRPAISINLPYIPSDEYFLRTKDSTFIAVLIKGLVQTVLPAIHQAFDGTGSNFGSYKDVEELYKSGLQLPASVNSSPLTPDAAAQPGDLVYLSTIFGAKGEDTSVLNYALPQVIAVDDKAWASDEEFGREALAGLHPTVIKLVTAYPPNSALDPAEYGQGTALTDQHIQPYLEGLTVAQAIKEKKLYIVDYHDAILPYINRVNADTKTGYLAYATRSIFFHTSAGPLKVIAIELSLPPAQKGGAASNRVFTPADATDHLWDLAKIHASAIDSNYHQVISHFTNCHAAMEPFIIATHRQLSALHPVNTLLTPYFKDTLAINAAAIAVLINAGGVVEKEFSMGQYALQVGSTGYGAFWQFDTQALPQSLIARGMAEPADESFPGSVKLVLEDYPFAKDALELWDAINKWVAKYVELTYKGSDDAVKADTELQAWWNEIRNVGHGDLKDATWWPKLDSTKNLVQIVSTIAWIAGPTHAALNFGQYAYYGYPPSKPSATRRLVPEKGSAEYKELQQNPDKFLLSSITSFTEATTVMTVVELLATHSVDEEYIGTRNSTNWTSDPQVLAAFSEFSQRVAAVEESITKRNADPTLVNRHGPVQVPYTLLVPSSTSGLTGRGVPNSVSI